MATRIPTHRPRQVGRQHIPDARARKLRGSGRYQRFRKWFMARHPLCDDPYGTHASEGRVEPSTQLHHRIKVTERPDLLCDPANAQALCVACHGKIEE